MSFTTIILCLPGLNGKILRFIPDTWWSNPSSATYKNLNTISYANGLFIAGGNAGALVKSVDPYFYPDDAQSGQTVCDNCRTAEDESQNESGAIEEEVAFRATAYPNPVDNQFSIKVEGAGGEKVRLQLLDVSGRMILDKVVTAETSTYQETIPMAQKHNGMYLLRVSTATHTQTLKILKQSFK